jgi:hypothetical protein
LLRMCDFRPSTQQEAVHADIVAFLGRGSHEQPDARGREFISERQLTRTHAHPFPAARIRDSRHPLAP